VYYNRNGTATAKSTRIYGEIAGDLFESQYSTVGSPKLPQILASSDLSDLQFLLSHTKTLFPVLDFPGELNWRLAEPKDGSTENPALQRIKSWRLVIS
jgi:hypothetical protein